MVLADLSENLTPPEQAQQRRTCGWRCAARSLDGEEAISFPVTVAVSTLARAERVLAQRLSLVRLDTAEAARDVDVADVAALCRDIAGELYSEAVQRGGDLGLDSPARAMAQVQPVPLAEMVTNLVDSALTHGGGVVTLRVTHEGARVTVAVEDDGPGLTAERAAAFLAGRPAGPLPDHAQGPAAMHRFGPAIVREIALRIGAEIGPERGLGGRGPVVTIGGPSA